MIRTGRTRILGGNGDHFDGKRFFNPEGEAPGGFGDLLKWKFGSRRAKWPTSVPVQQARPAKRVDDLTITMVGHATLLIQTAGVNILTDPIWSERASPLSFAGPKRVTEPGVALADLPPIDLILLTHNHYDHLDLPTLRALHDAHAPRIVTPLGNDDYLLGTVPDHLITVGDWEDEVEIGPLILTFAPCHHWSARGFRDRCRALWSGFLIDGPAGRLLHLGDTGFDEGRPYRDLPQQFGRLRAAILPIGAYEPRWFMRAYHQNPTEAVEGFLLSGADYAVGHHWGTFQLTDEARDAPHEALSNALTARGIPADRFRALTPGEAWVIPSVQVTNAET